MAGDRTGTPTVQTVARLIRPGERDMPWQHEARARTAIRRYLILMHGWTRWQRADAVALVLVHLARDENGVRLPSGYDSDADLSAWVPTEECVCCGRPFVRRYPDQTASNSKCSRRLAEIEWWQMQRAGAEGPPRCLYCHAFMEIDRPNQAYCNIRCKQAHNHIESYDQVDAELGRKIAAARYARGLTQAAVAASAGVTRAYVAMIEAGMVPATRGVREHILAVLELDPETPLVERARASVAGAGRASITCTPMPSFAAARIASAPGARVRTGTPTATATATTMKLTTDPPPPELVVIRREHPS